MFACLASILVGPTANNVKTTYLSKQPIRRQILGQVGQKTEDTDTQVGHRQVRKEEVRYGAHAPMT